MTTYEILCVVAICNGGHLYGANLSRADLSGANLSRADLSGANLSRAYLYWADLYWANLSRANGLEEARHLAQFRICPEGSIIGWKKLYGGVIAKLRIPEEAKRVNAYGSRKCRAEFADVIALSADTNGYDHHSRTIEYAPGKRVTPDSFDPDPRVECSHGIHFFITKEEAENY